MIDKQFKLFGKVSIADILLAVIVVVAVVLIIQFSSPTVANAKSGDTKIRYTVEMSSKKPEFADSIVVGEKLYDAVKGYSIGTIVSKSVVADRALVSDYEAEIIRDTEVDGLIRIFAVVEAMAVVSNETTTVSDEYEVLVGKAVYIKSKDFASGGYVVKLERLTN